MTTYTAIPNSDVDEDSPLSTALMSALRDNVLAIQEGDVSAPSILSGAIAGAAAGAIGTYVFATSSTGSNVSFGNTRAGSALKPTSAAAAHTRNTSEGNWNFIDGSALSGTWRCMGYYDDTVANGDGTIDGATLWLRIS